MEGKATDIESFVSTQLEKLLEETESVFARVALWNTKSQRLYLQIARGPAPNTPPCKAPAEKTENGLHTATVPLEIPISEVKGCLEAAKAKGPYTQRQREALKEKALIISFALSTQLLKGIATETKRLVETFYTLMELQAEEKDFCNAVLEKTKEFFNAPTCVITRLSEEKKSLKVICSSGDPPEGSIIRLGEGAAGEAARLQRPVIFEEYPEDMLPEACLNKKGIIASAIAIPIFVEGRLYGTLSFCRSAQQPRFTAVELEMLSSFQHIVNLLFSIHEYNKKKEIFNKLAIRTQKMEALGILAGGICHDFNNAINVIMGYAQICLEAVQDPLVKEHLEIILDECRRAAALTAQILSFSRESAPEKKLLDLKPLVKEFTKVIRLTMPENILINYEDDGHRMYPVVGSPEHIHTALMNIAVNSKDAMPEGGRLTIRLKKVIFPEEHPYPTRSVVIQVEDTGCGIPEEHIDKIFDPFFTTKGKNKGTGLGLYQTYSIVNNMGGTIDVKSKLGEGTTVSVILPEADEELLKDHLLSMDSAPPVYPEIKLKKKVLVVEDNIPLLNALLKMLESFGVKAEGFSNPVDALERIRKSPSEFEILITDVVMPNMDGISLSDAVRRFNPSIKVIYSTGYSDKGDELLARGRERNTVILLKPFTMFELAEAISKLSNR